jgi:hypothetical protein
MMDGEAPEVSMPKKSKAALAVVEPEPARIAPAQDNMGGLLQYLTEISEAGQSQVELNAMGEAADARRTLVEAMDQWVDALANAKAAEAIRKFLMRQAKGRVIFPGERRARRGSSRREAEPLGDEYALEPFFSSQPEARAVLAALPMNQRRKWAKYFDAYGCLLCGDRTQLHSGNGMCGRCRNRILERMKRLASGAVPTPSKRGRPELPFAGDDADEESNESPKRKDRKREVA